MKADFSFHRPLLAALSLAAASDLFAASDVPVRQTMCGGVGVTRFGSTFVYDGAPDIMPNVSFQLGNDNAREKVVPKETKDLTFNYVGAATTRMPISADRAELYEEPVHLIDGDLQTTWISHGRTRKDGEPIWIRIDLAAEREIRRIVLRKRPLPDGSARDEWTVTPYASAVEVGRSVPGRLTVSSARDAHRWTTLYDGVTYDVPTNESFEIVLDEPTRLKQLRLSGTELRLTENQLYGMSLAEVEVVDADGVNWALVSRGAGVQVNSAYHGDGVTYQEQRSYWPLHWKSGFKWARIGYHDDPINWHHVERTKGVYEVDPMADDAINELASNKVNIVMCLNFGNRLYSGPEEWKFRGFPEFDSCRPHPPTTEEALAAWEKYVAFMVSKYRDKVYCFEVWNEFMNFYWGAKPNADDYIRLAKRTIPIIRRLAPGVKVKAGAIGFNAGPGRLRGLSLWTKEDWDKWPNKGTAWRGIAGIAKDVDIIGFHPIYNPLDDFFTTYREDCALYFAWARKQGFTGGFQACEWSCPALYPSPDPKLTVAECWPDTPGNTEVEKAKKCVEMIMTNAGNDIPSMYCEMYQNFYALCDLSLFRMSNQADPIMPMQPQVAYYVMRNLATMTDGLRATDAFAAELVGCGKEARVYSFASENDKAVSVWIGSAEKRTDGYRIVPKTLVLPLPVREAWVYEPLNGVRQKLNVRAEGGRSVIDDLQVGDTPVVVRFR